MHRFHDGAFSEIHIEDVRLPSIWSKSCSDVVVGIVLVALSLNTKRVCSSLDQLLEKTLSLSLSLHISHSITFSEIVRLFLDTPPSHFPFLSDLLLFRNPPSRSPLLPIIKESSAEGFGCGDEHRFKSAGFRIRRSDT